MVTRFVVNYYILPIDVNAVARQNVVITTFCNVTTFWVASSVGMPHPLHMFYGNLGQLGKKSNSVIRPRSVTVKNWCNVLSMEGVTVCGHHPECRVTFGRGGPHIVW